MAKMSWRPENWENPHKGDRPDAGIPDQVHHAVYESGADAMLKALKEKGAYMTPEQMRLLAPDRQYPYGWIVFIPEDEEEK